MYVRGSRMPFVNWLKPWIAPTWTSTGPQPAQDAQDAGRAVDERARRSRARPARSRRTRSGRAPRRPSGRRGARCSAAASCGRGGKRSRVVGCGTSGTALVLAVGRRAARNGRASSAAHVAPRAGRRARRSVPGGAPAGIAATQRARRPGRGSAGRAHCSAVPTRRAPVASAIGVASRGVVEVPVADEDQPRAQLRDLGRRGRDVARRPPARRPRRRAARRGRAIAIAKLETPNHDRITRSRAHGAGAPVDVGGAEERRARVDHRRAAAQLPGPGRRPGQTAAGGRGERGQRRARAASRRITAEPARRRSRPRP